MVSIILFAGGAYAICGLLFAAFFLLRGVVQVDAAARGTSWRVKLLLLPGVAAFWPLLARKWFQAVRRATSAKPARASE